MIRRRLFLRFPRSETEKPILYHLVKDFDLLISIFRAKVTPDESGFLVVEVEGSEEKLDQGIDFIESHNITVDTLAKSLMWNPDKCTHCGNCLPHCPTQALKIADPDTRRITFDEKECIECLNCIDNCPYNACTSAF